MKQAIEAKLKPIHSRGRPTRLFDSDADSDGVDGSLDEDLLLVITTDDHRLKQQLFTAPVMTSPFSQQNKPQACSLLNCSTLQKSAKYVRKQDVASLRRLILQPCPHLFFWGFFPLLFGSYIF